MIISDHETEKIKKGKIVLAGGCFDILHPGHIEFLEKSKEEGNILVVLLESDENISKIKGPTRPKNSQLDRANSLDKLGIIDYIVLLTLPESSEYYYNLVKLVHPAIIAVTEGDPLLNVKKDQAKLVGGDVKAVMKRNKKHSTSSLLNQ